MKHWLQEDAFERLLKADIIEPMVDKQTGEVVYAMTPEGKTRTARGNETCPSCGVDPLMVNDLIDLNEQQKADLGAKNLTIGRLKAQIKGERKKKRDNEMIERIYNLWLEILGKSPKRYKLTPDRMDAIQYCIESDYSMDDFREAFLGAKHDAFVNENGKRFDDLELICRKNTRNIESFRDRWLPIKAKKEMLEKAEDEIGRRVGTLKNLGLYEKFDLGHHIARCPLCNPVTDREGRMIVTFTEYRCDATDHDSADIELKLLHMQRETRTTEGQGALV